MARINKEALLAALRDHLRLEIEDGGFTDPNRRQVALVWQDPEDDEGEVICRASFDVVQRREYEG